MSLVSNNTINGPAVTAQGNSQAPSSSARLSSGPKSFQAQLQAVRAEKAPELDAHSKPESLTRSAETVVRELINRWDVVESSRQESLKQLDPQARSFIELQMTVYELGLETQLFAKLGEALSGTLRRIQQMGSS